MKYFIKLSTGEYSDYSPDYYMGESLITQEELDKKAIEVGDKLIAEYEALPEKPFENWYDKHLENKKYDVVTGKKVYPPGDSEWQPIMEKWLLEEKGYEKLDESKIPEVNVSYSDLPNSRNWRNN